MIWQNAEKKPAGEKPTRKNQQPDVQLEAGLFTKSKEAIESAGHANAAKENADGDTALR